MLNALIQILMMLIPIALQVFILHLGVYYGMRRFNRWEERQNQAKYSGLINGAKPRNRK